MLRTDKNKFLVAVFGDYLPSLSNQGESAYFSSAGILSMEQVLMNSLVMLFSDSFENHFNE